MSKKLQATSYKIQNKRGFTLLELMVSIGIIGVLVTMGIVTYSPIQKKARDAKRKSDMKQIHDALEQHYSICGFVYPTPDVSNKVPTSITCASPASTFLNPVPVDPKDKVTRYDMTGTGSSYSISTSLMEQETNPYTVNSQQ